MGTIQWVAQNSTTTIKGKGYGTNKQVLAGVREQLSKLAGISTSKVKVGESFRVSLLKENAVCGAWTMKAKEKKVVKAKKALKKVLVAKGK